MKNAERGTHATPIQPEVTDYPCEWMNIETAPKDGTFVLLLADSGYIGAPYRIAVGQWIPNYKNTWTTHSGARFTDDGEPPSHWMPLKRRFPA